METVDEFVDQHSPQSSRGDFLYHVTTADRVPAIREEGLDPSASRLQTCPGELALKVLADRSQSDDFQLVSGDHPLPFDRRQSVFAWPTPPTETVSDGMAIIVIRTADVDSRMFLAGHDLIDGLIKNAPRKHELREEDTATIDDRWMSLLPSAITYLSTIKPIESAEDIRETAGICNPEAVIEGEVPPDAFEAVLTPSDGGSPQSA